MRCALSQPRDCTHPCWLGPALPCSRFLGFSHLPAAHCTAPLVGEVTQGNADKKVSIGGKKVELNTFTVLCPSPLTLLSAPLHRKVLVLPTNPMWPHRWNSTLREPLPAQPTAWPGWFPPGVRLAWGMS